MTATDPWAYGQIFRRPATGGDATALAGFGYGIGRRSHRSDA
ncbi:hypothetical protein [Streptomyces sp. ISL-1]|nr:hypothetical protein [Streptomyces sp. ISL-1]